MRRYVDAVQLFGVAGIPNDTPTNRYFNDPEILEIIEGANQVERHVIACNPLGPSGDLC